jgi:hypothetical protein
LSQFHCHPASYKGHAGESLTKFCCESAERILFRNYEGEVFEYPEADDGTPLFAAAAELGAVQVG